MPILKLRQINRQRRKKSRFTSLRMGCWWLYYAIGEENRYWVVRPESVDLGVVSHLIVQLTQLCLLVYRYSNSSPAC